MSKRRSAISLIADSLLLTASLALLLFDLLETRDILWAAGAVLGVFIFSARLGRDVRRLRTR